MNSLTRKTRFALIAALLLTVAFGACACSHASTSMGTITRVVDVTIDQAELDQGGSFSTSGTFGPYDRLLDEVARIEIHDGFLRYTGFKTQPDGSRLPGSFDLSLGAANGMLKAQVTAVRIPGMTLSDALIIRGNRWPESELSQMLLASPADVDFLEVTAREGALDMKVRVRVDMR